MNPDEAVAYGATIEAAIQMGAYAEDVVLLDVCAFSLGIATHNKEDKNNHLMGKIIMKGTKLPCKKSIYVLLFMTIKLLYVYKFLKVKINT